MSPGSPTAKGSNAERTAVKEKEASLQPSETKPGGKGLPILSKILLVGGYLLGAYIGENALLRIALFGCGSGYLVELVWILRRGGS